MKEADNGSAVVVLDKSLYIQKANRHLCDSNVYKPLESDCTSDIIGEIQSTIQILENQGVLTKDMVNYANPAGTRPGRFYLLPKVHKSGVPGRPVISSCSSPTEKNSELVDYFLKPLMSSIPTFLPDSFDFLDKLRSVVRFQDNLLLVTIDVVSLYPSIPHDDGINALSDFLDSHHYVRSVRDGIC